jgi:hypothetical protein
MDTFVGNVVNLVLNTAVTLTGATTLLIKYRKPDGTTGAWVSTIVAGSPKYMEYETGTDDLDQNGIWRLSAYAIIGGSVLDGVIVSIEVHNPISISGFVTTAAPTSAPPTTAP